MSSIVIFGGTVGAALDIGHYQRQCHHVVDSKRCGKSDRIAADITIASRRGIDIHAEIRRVHHRLRRTAV